MLLALDTVFGQCSVAIVTLAGDVRHDATMMGSREQTQQILPMIDAALSAVGIGLDEITALAFNRGPGAFSGIRINTAVVQALSLAHELPCVAISSLQVLAQAAYEQHHIEQCYAVHDARMQQVYLGAFAQQHDVMQPQALHAQQLTTADTQKDEMLKNDSVADASLANASLEFLVDYGSQSQLKLALVGDGASLLNAHDGQPVVTELKLDAAILGRLAIAKFAQFGGVPAAQALPVYLRNNAWKTLKEQGRA